LQAFLALIVALALQIAVNYSNDYSDGIRGTDDVRVGPIRLTASGLASAKAVKRAAFISFGVACVAGLALAATSSWWILIVGVISVLAAWGYTGGHTPYGYLGFGELSVFTFFGVVATVGTYYVQTLEFSAAAFAASVSMGSLSCALLAINNIRDRAQDAQVGKKTLAVRLGDEKRSPLLYRTLSLALHLRPTHRKSASFSHTCFCASRPCRSRAKYARVQRAKRLFHSLEEPANCNFTSLSHSLSRSRSSR
jgi:1,4-dihydroxy-2-naphthoate polyprenyltransferase